MNHGAKASYYVCDSVCIYIFCHQYVPVLYVYHYLHTFALQKAV